MMILIIIVVVLVAVYLLFKTTSYTNDETALYHQLLRKCFGDEALVERLIELERKITPNADRATLIRMAIARLNKDNR